MTYIRRDYRKHLSSPALIFIAGKEIPCTILDLSISGIKIKLHTTDSIQKPASLADEIKINELADFYVREMHFDGKVKIIRKEIIGQALLLSLSYEDVFFGLKHLPYRRRHYRSNCLSSGKIYINQQVHNAVSHDLSLDGMQLAISETVDFKVDDELILDFEQINVSGQSRIKWQKEQPDQCLLGIEFIHLIEPVKGIAAFSPQN